jgi:hypothetical protein
VTSLEFSVRHVGQGCQFGVKRAKFLDFGFIKLKLATKNFVWLLSIFWLFLAAFLLNTEISNFSKIVCHPSVKVSYKLCYVRLHYPFMTFIRDSRGGWTAGRKASWVLSA